MNSGHSDKHRGGILLLCVLGLVCAGAVAAERRLAASNAPPSCCAPATAAAPDTRGTPEHPLIVTSTGSQAEIDAAERDRVERWRADMRTFWLGVFTAVILVVQFAAFALQAWLVRRSIQSSEATARRQLKAYVFVESAHVGGVLPNGQPVANVWLHNFGETPAYKLRVLIGFGVAASFAELPVAAEPVVNSMGNLGPGAKVMVSNHPPPTLSPEMYTALSDGRRTLFVYGTVWYEDAFGNAQRFLNFRTMLGGKVGLGDGRLASCEEGNDADEPE